MTPLIILREYSVTHMAVGANTGQSPNYVSMLGQRRIWLTGIEPAMGCDAGPTLNYWVGRPTLCVRGTSLDAYTDLSVNVTVRSGVKKTRCRTLHWQVLHRCWPVPAMEGIHVEDIIVSLVLLIIIPGHLGCWPMMKTNTVCLQNIRPCFCLKHSNSLKPGLRVRELLF